MKSEADPVPDKKSKVKEKSERPGSSHDEIDSDGSASAFSGSELVPEPPDDEKKIRSATDPDPSGNSDY